MIYDNDDVLVCVEGMVIITYLFEKKIVKYEN